MTVAHRSITSAVATLAQELGAPFSLSTVQDLASQMADLHSRNTDHLRVMAGALGISDHGAGLPIDSMGWEITLRDLSRFIAAEKERV